MPKTAVLHIGTHKTGTTTLQIFFLQNRDAFARGGVYLADTGRSNIAVTGNHEIGWELLTGGQSNTLAALTSELSRNDLPTALLTSEDLCLLFARPATLSMLRDAVANAGYQSKVVVYFRPQAGYAESIYVERIKHDYVRTMGSFIEQSLATGMYRPDDSPIQIEFEYRRLLEPWIDAFGRENVIVRAYQPGVANDAIFRDFIGILSDVTPGFAQTPMQLEVSQPRANDSLSFGGLLQTAFSKLLPALPAQLEPGTLIRANVPNFSEQLFQQRYALISREETLAFLRAFGPGNAQIERDFGIRIPFQNEADVLPADHPSWERARVERSIFDQLLDLWMAKK
jgi:hypothetical protein